MWRWLLTMVVVVLMIPVAASAQSSKVIPKNCIYQMQLPEGITTHMFVGASESFCVKIVNDAFKGVKARRVLNLKNAGPKRCEFKSTKMKGIVWRIYAKDATYGTLFCAGMGLTSK